ncbi:MAG: glycosyltransferase family 4 protein [Spirochaetes bacterium]|nr:glycosyltransferase family 4 protein [Spirochaetota bacterium]
MQKIKICHISTVHPAFDVRIFHKECKTLLDAGYDVSFIVQHDKEEIIEGIKIIPLPKPKNRLNRMLFLPFKAYKLALKQNAEIYHFHDPELIFIGLLLKLKGKKVIYDVHEDVPRQILNKQYLKKHISYVISYLFEKFENLFARRFDFLIAATPHIRDRFLKINKNTIDINNFTLLKEMYSKLQWEERENNIAYIGGITKIRGIIELVKALEYINIDINLYLAGDFENKNLEQYVKSLNGWKKVKYYGYIEREGISKILKNSKIGIVTLHPTTNYFESLPVKMFEYMSAGIPVIASNFPLWKEIVEGNKCGICIDPQSPEEIAKAVEYLLNNPEIAKQMGENGRKVVEEKYNWEKEGKKLLEVYSIIVNKLNQEFK